jgi:hypothetical protein
LTARCLAADDAGGAGDGLLTKDLGGHLAADRHDVEERVHDAVGGGVGRLPVAPEPGVTGCGERPERALKGCVAPEHHVVGEADELLVSIDSDLPYGADRELPGDPLAEDGELVGRYAAPLGVLVDERVEQIEGGGIGDGDHDGGLLSLLT